MKDKKDFFECAQQLKDKILQIIEHAHNDSHAYVEQQVEYLNRTLKPLDIHIKLENIVHEQLMAHENRFAPAFSLQCDNVIFSYTRNKFWERYIIRNEVEDIVQIAPLNREYREITANEWYQLKDIVTTVNSFLNIAEKQHTATNKTRFK